MIIGAAIGDLGRHTAVDPATGYPITTHRTTVFLQVSCSLLSVKMCRN